MSTVPAEPYPWPFDGRLSAAGTALVVCGAQRWFAERTTEAAATLETAARLASALADRRIPAFATIHGLARSPRRPTLPRHGSPECTPLLDGGCKTVHCLGFDGFFASALDAHLQTRRIERILFAGLGLEGPIHSTLRSANDRGYECLVVTDAAAPHDPGLADAAYSTIALSGGIFGAFADSQALLCALDLAASSTGVLI